DADWLASTTAISKLAATSGEACESERSPDRAGRLRAVGNGVKLRKTRGLIRYHGLLGSFDPYRNLVAFGRGLGLALSPEIWRPGGGRVVAGPALRPLVLPARRRLRGDCRKADIRRLSVD